MKAPDSFPPLSPSLVVHDAAAAIEFYQKAFGAEEYYRLTDPESGKIGHAELSIHGALLMVADEYPEWNKSARTLGGSPVRLALMCDDVDAVFDQAVAAGAEVRRPLNDEFYGHRAATLRDPFGHEWMIAQEIEKVSPEEMQRRWSALVAGPSPNE